MIRIKPKEANPQNPTDNPMRVGCLTASEGKRALLLTKAGKPPSTETAYAMELAIQRIKGRIKPKWKEGFEPAPVKRGKRLEPYALAEWEERHGVECEYRDFDLHESILYFGASPDSVIEDYLIEVKAMNESRHGEMLYANKIPPEYQLQMDIQLACWKHKGYKKVIFLSYEDEDLPYRGWRLAETVYEPEPGRIEEIEEAAKKFLTKVKEIERTIRNKKDEQFEPLNYQWTRRK